MNKALRDAREAAWLTRAERLAAGHDPDRPRQKLSQAQLADRAGVSERTIWEAEHGQGTLRRGSMVLIAFALGHKVHDFWPGVEISRRKAA